MQTCGRRNDKQTKRSLCYNQKTTDSRRRCRFGKVNKHLTVTRILSQHCFWGYVKYLYFQPRQSTFYTHNVTIFYIRIVILATQKDLRTIAQVLLFNALHYKQLNVGKLLFILYPRKNARRVQFDPIEISSACDIGFFLTRHLVG